MDAVFSQLYVVEASVVGSAGCVGHVDVHGEWVMLWVVAMYNAVTIQGEIKHWNKMLI